MMVRNYHERYIEITFTRIERDLIMAKENLIAQKEHANIGTIGHVDHGKLLLLRINAYRNRIISYEW